MEHSTIQSEETAESSDEDSTFNTNQTNYNETPTTNTITTIHITDKVSGSRGPVSADALNQPGLTDNPRDSLTNSVNEMKNNATNPTTLQYRTTDKASGRRAPPQCGRSGPTGTGEHLPTLVGKLHGLQSALCTGNARSGAAEQGRPRQCGSYSPTGTGGQLFTLQCSWKRDGKGSLLPFPFGQRGIEGLQNEPGQRGNQVG